MKMNPFTPPSHHHHKNRVDGTVSLHKVTFFFKAFDYQLWQRWHSGRAKKPHIFHVSELLLNVVSDPGVSVRLFITLVLWSFKWQVKGHLEGWEMTKMFPPVSSKDASTAGSRGRTFKIKHRIIFETPEIANEIVMLWCAMNRSDFKWVLETWECKACKKSYYNDAPVITSCQWVKLSLWWRAVDIIE